ncbi:MAG: formylglycine-generating enzyme family protein [Bacteroidales bacterium]|nr:formylglycine-generating enzyme family protein [Bacteroidales bacterium]
MKKLLGIILALLISVPMFSQGKENFKEEAFGIEISMIYVQGGEFVMGGTSEQGKEADKDEVIHRVTVGDFYIGQFEITQAQWEAVMETSVVQQSRKADAKLTLDKLNGVGSDYPMYYVSWDEAMEFCRILSKKTGKRYSLPTEAEWEYAARGGVKGDKKFRTKYAGSNMPERVAWYDRGSSHPVGQKEANELDIYDMSGNVWEWCLDWYGAYNKNENVNPEGPSIGTERVLRGGSWHNPASRSRVSYRGHNSPDRRAGYRGFRIVCHDEDGAEPQGNDDNGNDDDDED